MTTSIETAAFSSVDTPLGVFSMITDENDAVLASGWTQDQERLLRLIHSTLRPHTLHRVADSPLHSVVQEYHAGAVGVLENVSVRTHASPFRARVWETLRKIPPGEPATYAELAEWAGTPKAARAAGSGCATNPAALFIPCHRVVPSGGGVGQFGYGPEVKRQLLQLESAYRL